VSERRASILVGAFAVGALLITLVGALFFAGAGIGVERRRVAMVFDGSLRGLNVGAPVALRGVTVGQVTDIDLLLNAQEGALIMVVEAEIDPSTIQLVGQGGDDLAEELVERGLRAQLGLQSLLTGLLYIQLDFRPDNEPHLVELDSDLPQIPTIPTELEQLRSSLDKLDYAAITDSLDRIAHSLDDLLSSDDTQGLPASLRSTLASVEAASQALEQAVSENSGKLAELLDSGTASLTQVGEQLPQMTASVSSSLARLDEALQAAQGSLQNIEDATAPESAPRQQLSIALEELRLAARALRSLAQTLEENPQSLLRGRRETTLE
jgi:paraquat-inducible protein B